MNQQQEEALSYFHRAAQGWRRSAEGDPSKVNIIQHRNHFAERVALARRAKTALDIGCGTGELVISLAQRNVEAEGIDFAPDMIRLSSEKSAGVNGAKFQCFSVFDFQPTHKFDAISANGFIEYISPQQMSELFTKVRNWLSPGGSFVVGSRNRLFNAFSLNAYTQKEIDAGSIVSLIEESLVIAQAASMQEMIKSLRNVHGATKNLESHPYTGIDVSVRYQYTPAQLIKELERHGFQTKTLKHIHYHGLPPTFAGSHSDIHVPIANTAEEFGEGILLPQSSSFMLHADAA